MIFPMNFINMSIKKLGQSNMKKVINKIKGNGLFHKMSEEEIEKTLNCSNAQVKTYSKNQKIFSQEDPPKSLYILLSGSVVVCKDSPSGKRYIVTSILENDMFGEVYVFLEEEDYPYYALSTSKSDVLEIPKAFFFTYCDVDCNGHNLLIRNMLKILAKKAFFLNNKVQLLSHGSLRQKISKYLLEQKNQYIYIKLNMNREELAGYLRVARPSLSRELTKMQNDGLIEVDRDMIKIIDLEELMACAKDMDD